MTNNEKLFNELRDLNLPADEYIVVASGPMGIRGLRDMSDIDILVTDRLWDELELTHKRFYEHEAFKIRLSENVEAMCQDSFGNRNPDSPSSEKQISDREIIDGLPFQNIKSTLYFKKMGVREKDIKDVKIIEEWLKNNH